MTKFLTIEEAMKKGKGKVIVRGWARRERKSNAFIFIILRDHTEDIQCVIEKENVSEDVWKTAEKVTVESSLVIEGDIIKDKRAKSGYEIHVKKLEIVHLAERFPIARDLSTEFLLDVRHLWLRSRKLATIFKVRDTVLWSIRDFFHKHGYYEWTPPIFTPTACEGGATLFEVKYFDEKAYLTQSWQLYAETGIFGLEKIFTISPCFRAERSKTSRHLTEFLMAEVETAWQTFPEMLTQAEELISYVVQQVVKKHEKDLKELGQDVAKLKKVKAPFPKITYTEALKILKDKEKMDIPWGKDLRTIEEDKLMKHFDKPIIVTHYPKEIMAFYKPADPKDPKTAVCMDMLLPEGYGEVMGGSKRDEDIKAMKKALKDSGQKPKDYEWYFDTRRYGSVPHCGFGVGVERLIAWICKLEHIRDAMPFPRTMVRKSP